jgi:hypothetical protein
VFALSLQMSIPEMEYIPIVVQPQNLFLSMFSQLLCMVVKLMCICAGFFFYLCFVAGDVDSGNRVYILLSVVTPKLFLVHVFVIAVNGRQVHVYRYRFFFSFFCFVAGDANSESGVVIPVSIDETFLSHELQMYYT